MAIENQLITWDIEGSFGSNSPPPQHIPVEYPDSGSSTQAARLLIVLSEGEIESVDTVYLKQVPSSDYNVTVESRRGTLDQTVINGFTEVYAPLPSNSAIVTTTSPAEVGVPKLFDAVSITQTLNGLIQQHSNGDTTGTSITIDYYTKLGATAPWVYHSRKTISAKYSSTYAFSKMIERPVGVIEDNWYVRIVRVTADSTSQKLVNGLTFSQGIGVKWSSLSYPGKALLGLTLNDARQFGGSIPEILAKVKGIKVRLPSNYNPVTRVYTGIWDGSFALANQYTSNPAWCLFHCLTNEAVGLGLSDDEIDIFAFYELGKHCDGLVTDGKGGLEPRYTINCQFIVRENLATFFMYFLTLMNANWSANEFGQVSLMWDRADQPVTKQVTNATVVDGLFNYSSTDLEQRCNFVSVTFSDPEAFGRTNTVVEWNDCLIDRYGLQQLDIVLVGCTSKAQALRKARWALYNSSYLYDMIEFKVLFEGLIYYVGEIISICDNFNQTDMTAGMFTDVVATGLSVVVSFDRPLEVLNIPYNITYLCADGVSQHTVVFTPTAGTISSLTFTVTDETLIPLVATFILKPVTVAGKLYKVIKVVKDGESYSITAMGHSEAKYAFIEQKPLVITDPTGDFANITYETIDPIPDITFTPTYTVSPDGLFGIDLTLAWTYVTNPIKINGAIDYRIFAFSVGYQVNNGNWTTVITSNPSYVIPNAAVGDYVVSIAVIDTTNERSSPLYTETYAFNPGTGDSDLAPPVNLYVKGTTSTYFNAADVDITWDYAVVNDLVFDVLNYYIVRIEDTVGNLLTPEINVAPNALKGGSIYSGATAAANLNITPLRDTVIKVYSVDVMLNRSITPVAATFHKIPPPAPAFTVVNNGTSFTVAITSILGYGVTTYNIYAGATAGFTKNASSLVKSFAMDYTQVPPAYTVLDVSFPSWLVTGGDIFFAVEALDGFS